MNNANTPTTFNVPSIGNTTAPVMDDIEGNAVEVYNISAD